MMVFLAKDDAEYVIRVEGRLGAEWAERTGLAVSVQEGAGMRTTTQLTGRLPDEAALMGILSHLYSLGAHLLRVERIPSAPHESGNKELL